MENKRVSEIELRFVLKAELQDAILKSAELIKDGYVVSDFRIDPPKCFYTGSLDPYREPDTIIGFVKKEW